MSPLATDRPASQRLVIVHFIGSLAIGGAERQLLELIGHLPDDRFEQHLALFHRSGAFLPELRGPQSEVYELLRPGPRSRWWLVRNLQRVADALRFVRYLRRTRPDVLHAQLPAATIVGAVAGRLAGVPVVVASQLNQCRDLDGITRRQRIENRALRAATNVHVNSQAVGRDVVRYQGVDAARVALIPNGIDTDRLAPPTAQAREAARRSAGFDGDDRLVLCVSNLFPYKGHLDLLDAFARLDPAAWNAHLVLVGRDEGSGPEIDVRAAALGIDERVHRVGPSATVETWYAAADVVAHPSHEEGFSNAILEAMSSGLPVVACDVGGNAEAVIDGVTGLLVPARDPDALAAALAAVLTDPHAAAEMGRHGRARVEQQFGTARMAHQFAACYQRLTRGNRRRWVGFRLGARSSARTRRRTTGSSTGHDR